jgi:hypothetical protein
MKNKINGFRWARNYAFFTIFVTLFSQLLTWMGVKNDMMPFLSIAVFVLELLFIYHIYEGSIQYLIMIGDKADAEHYVNVQRAFIILFIIDALMACAALTLADQLMNMSAAILGVLLIISLMISLRTIKNIEPPSIDIIV